MRIGVIESRFEGMVYGSFSDNYSKQLDSYEKTIDSLICLNINCLDYFDATENYSEGGAINETFESKYK